MAARLVGHRRASRARVWPSSAAMRSTRPRRAAAAPRRRGAGRRGRRRRRRPAAGRTATTARRKRSGIWTQDAGAVAGVGVGAGGAAVLEVDRAGRARARTMACERWPLMWATKPTPQASCSSAARYSPPPRRAAPRRAWRRPGYTGRPGRPPMMWFAIAWSPMRAPIRENRNSIRKAQCVYTIDAIAG